MYYLDHHIAFLQCFLQFRIKFHECRAAFVNNIRSFGKSDEDASFRIGRSIATMNPNAAEHWHIQHMRHITSEPFREIDDDFVESVWNRRPSRDFYSRSADGIFQREAFEFVIDI